MSLIILFRCGIGEHALIARKRKKKEKKGEKEGKKRGKKKERKKEKKGEKKGTEMNDGNLATSLTLFE